MYELKSKEAPHDHRVDKSLNNFGLNARAAVKERRKILPSRAGPLASRRSLEATGTLLLTPTKAQQRSVARLCTKIKRETMGLIDAAC